METILDEIQRSIAIPPGCTLQLPSNARVRVSDEVKPFVAPTLHPREDLAIGPDDASGPVDIYLIEARAAVGKTTLSQWLSFASQCPRLDLARHNVGAGTFRGLLPGQRCGSDGGTVDGPQALASGALTMIVDAVDEGRLLSGEAAIQAFLEDTWEVLTERTERHGRPAVIFLGRPQAMELVADSLAVFNAGSNLHPRLTSRHLSVEFFDEAQARELVSRYARVQAIQKDNLATLESHGAAVDSLLDSYFHAVAAALDQSSADLWTSDDSRQFSGYAPVLELLGRIIGEATNPSAIEASIIGDATRAWSVIEHVCQRVLDREADKVHARLRKRFGADAVIPGHAYSPGEQINAILARIEGRIINDQVVRSVNSFESVRQTEYLELVRTWVDEHPFLRVEDRTITFSNPILGAIVGAEGLTQGAIETGRDEIASLGRQGFLWSAIVHRSEESREQENGLPLVDGHGLDVLVQSHGTQRLDRSVLIIEQDESGNTRLVQSFPGRRVPILEATSPVKLGPILDSIRVDVDHLILSGKRIDLFGDVKVRCRRLEMRSQHLAVGSGADAWIEVEEELIQVSGWTNIDLGRGQAGSAEPARLRVAGQGPTGAGNWNQFATEGRSPFSDGAVEHDPVFEFLQLLSRETYMVVTADRYEIDDNRLRSIKREAGSRWPEIAKLLIDRNLATRENINAGGSSKVRLRFQLRELLDDARKESPPPGYAELAEKLRSLLPKS